MYVAVKGGEAAVINSRKFFADTGRGNKDISEIRPEQIENQLGLAVDRVMAEGSLYDTNAAATAIRQAQGDLVEAVFLVRAFRNTLKRFGNSRPVQTDRIRILRRISGAFKDIPGGQILGPTCDYTHRLIEFSEPETPEKKIHENISTDFLGGNDFCNGKNRIPWVIDILKNQGLMKDKPDELIGSAVEDLTRQPLDIPASRSIRLQALARGDEGFLLGSAYSLQRGFGLDRHPFLGELRVGYVEIMVAPPELDFDIRIGEIKITECFMINRTDGSDTGSPVFETGYGLVFGHNERKAMSMALLDRSLGESEKTGENAFPAQDQEFILAHGDNVESSGFVQHLKLPHYVDFQSELVFVRNFHKTRKDEKDKQDASEI